MLMRFCYLISLFSWGLVAYGLYTLFFNSGSPPSIFTIVLAIGMSLGLGVILYIHISLLREEIK